MSEMNNDFGDGVVCYESMEELKNDNPLACATLKTMTSGYTFGEDGLVPPAQKTVSSSLPKPR